MEWGLGLAPVQKGRGGTSRGGPLKCGVPEFGGKSLGEGLWVRFRPRAVGGDLRVPPVEVGLWVGV